jgi:tetratricopeptide (TPR) repeat protein
MLGLCLAERKLFKEAVREGEIARKLGWHLPFVHYSLAHILHDWGRVDEALVSVWQAIQLLDQARPDYLALLSALELRKDRREEALEAAEWGLRLDPIHPGCINARAAALMLLGREEEAEEAIEMALVVDPENPDLHANRGWLNLRRGAAERALEDFQEALRLDPDLDRARQGLIEALKARHGLYTFLLRWFLRLLTVDRKVRWGITLGGSAAIFALLVALAGLALTHATYRLWLWPAMLVLMSVVLIYPLSNLILRFHPLGRHLLSPKQVEDALIVGGIMVVEALAGVGMIAGNAVLLFLAVFGGCLAPLVVYTFQCPRGWPRLLMAAYTLGEALFGLGVLALLMYGFTLTSSQAYRFAPFFLLTFVLFLLAVIPGLLLADWLKAPSSWLRRRGRRLPWPAWLAA